MGGYSCIVKAPADLLAGDAAAPPADLLMIVLHGLGATNTDLENVPSTLAGFDSKLGGARIVAVCPQAPAGQMGMSAWWQFDLMGFMQALMNPAQSEALMARLIRETPPGLNDCRAQMKTLVDEARALAGGSAGALPHAKRKDARDASGRTAAAWALRRDHLVLAETLRVDTSTYPPLDAAKPKGSKKQFTKF